VPSRPATLVLPEIVGPAAVVGLAGLIEAVTRLGVRVPNPPAIVLTLVVASAFVSGLRAGLASAAIACLWFVTLSAPPERLSIHDENLQRDVVFVVTTPLMAAMAGLLKRRGDQIAQASLEKEREHSASLLALLEERKRVAADLSRAKDAAEAASRTKSEFLANVSHEIRTPLNGILGMTALTLRTEVTREQREYLEILRSSADTLLSLIGDILDFSKIEAGRLDLEPVPFEVDEVVGNSVRALSLRAADSGLSVTYAIAPGVPKVLVGDPLRLRQVLVNLLANAIKFTEKGEIVVRVALEREGEHDAVLSIAVKDTGIGIPKDKQELIFEAFSQADGSTTRKYGGTGLGLAISKRLVEMMGGTIGVESEPGRGATFSFTARFSKPEPDHVSVSSVPVEKPRAVSPLGSLSVLVAEDNAVNRLLLTRFLESEGHRPTVVTSGKDVLSALAEGPFDVVLMDIQMPEMDGLTTARRIREREREEGGHVPLVAVTAHAMKGDRERCLEAGYDGYLTKPISFPELLTTLRTVLPAEKLRLAHDEPKAEPAFAPAPPAAAAGERGFDESGALARAGGDRTLLLELVDVFVSEAPAWLTELEAALAKGDAAVVRRVAHTIKGAVGTCGVRGGFDAAAGIERLARDGALDAARAAEMTAELRGAIDAALPAMRAMKGAQ
jgi:signal transduction histidine kinase/DNA-binding response OmpR family regulator